MQINSKMTQFLDKMSKKNETECLTGLTHLVHCCWFFSFSIITTTN